MTYSKQEKTGKDQGKRAIPRHIAIIMDGNGRWAAKRGLPRVVGHRRGVESLRETVRAAIDLNISHLTLYSFSSENWLRPEQEISDLMSLLRRFIRRDLAELHGHEIRIRVIGEEQGVAPDILKLIKEAEVLTEKNDHFHLTIAFNYGARNEIVEAARRLGRKIHDGSLDPEDITTDLFSLHLDTADLPDPDLLIRTSGEYRMSNFLLWQCAYTEFVFLDEFWPDFNRELLEKAIAIYQNRERRFGGLLERSSA